ncbi:hypothetical protein ACLQ18_35405 [Streptomyces sp. DT193]|uniref:hypothetical protein n=1 Tax=Streptomyces sp. DT193 TaxID=3393418 RepID=UPI003CE93C30
MVNHLARATTVPPADWGQDREHPFAAAAVSSGSAPLVCAAATPIDPMVVVGDEREWDPDLLRLRGQMEDRFLHALRADLSGAPTTVQEASAPLLVEPVDLGDSLSHQLEKNGELWQLREYAALRSLHR